MSKGIVTGDDVLYAYGRVLKSFIGRDGLPKDTKVVASETSAGFILYPGGKRGKREGLQVYVRVAKYSEALLKQKPETGGLLENEE